MQKDLVYLANNYEYEMSHFYISDILSDNFSLSIVSSNSITDFFDDLKSIFSDITGLSPKTSHRSDIDDILNNLKDEKTIFRIK